MSKDIRGNDWFGCFSSKLILLFYYYFVGTLMIVLSILFECQEKTATATYLSLSGCGVKCFLGRMSRGQRVDVKNGIRRNLIQTHSEVWRPKLHVSWGRNRLTCCYWKISSIDAS